MPGNTDLFFVKHDERDRWDSAISLFPGAGIFHTWDWASVFVEAYRHGPVLVCAGTPDRITACLPVSLVRRPLLRPLAVSMPYSDFAGPLPLAVGHKGMLAKLPSALDVSRVEVRSEVDLTGEGDGTGFQTYRLELADTEEEMLSRLPSKSVRYPIRKAGRDGMTVRPAGTGDIPTFHRLVNLTRRRHGLPTPPLRFYRALERHILDRGKGTLFLAEDPEGRVAAGSLFLWHGDMGYYKYSAGDPSLSPGNAGHLLLWEGVREGIRKGLAAFDLGRVSMSNAGLAKFKRHWGGVPAPLHYVTVSADGTIGNASAGDGGGLPLARKLFTALPPVFSRIAGDLVYRYFS